MRGFAQRSRRDLLRAVATTAWAATAGGTSACAGFPAAAPAQASSEWPEGLAHHARRAGLFYGTALEPEPLADDLGFAAAVLRETGMVVTQNAAKWKRIHPRRDRFAFGRTDALAGFARSNDLLFRGHTLVWHVDLPGWVNSDMDPAELGEVLTKHVETIVRRYAGAHSWDVVNEAIDPEDGRTDGMRRTVFLDRLGPGYVSAAFHAARQADPQTMLVYNDIDLARYGYDRKRDAVLAFLERERTAGTPIDALGIQSHLRAGERQLTPSVLTDFISSVRSLGLKVIVSELDVRDDAVAGSPDRRDRIVAGVALDYLSTVLADPSVIGVVTWGLSDRYSYLTEFHPRSDGTLPRGLPLSDMLVRKPLWHAIVAAFATAPPR